jgi:uncharacterized membrane protein
VDVDGFTLAVILGMAAVTYATRAGGFALMRWVPLSPRVDAFLRDIPTAAIGAMLVPVLLRAQPFELGAVAVTLLVMLWTRHDLAAVGAATAVGALLGGWPF